MIAEFNEHGGFVHSWALRQRRRWWWCGVLVLVVALGVLSRQQHRPGQSDAILAAAVQRDFGFRFFAAASPSATENCLFSPYSLAQCLGLTCNGARGHTRAGLVKALGVQYLPLEELNADQSALVQALQQPARPAGDRAQVARPPGVGVEIQSANALWTRAATPCQPAFLRLAREGYQAQVTALNFASPDAEATINQWAADNTHGHITTLLKPGDLDAASRLVLTDTVYFHAEWTYPFRPSMTEPMPFTRGDGTTAPVRMMSQIGRFRYFSTADFQVIRLPYAREQRFAMLIFLPRTGKTLGDITRQFHFDRWLQWHKRFKARTCRLFLPYFDVTEELELKTPLVRMGMADAFSPTADFSGMTGRKAVALSLARHTARLSVNEAGTEAAAATVLGATLDGGSDDEVPPLSVLIDHPFVFAIEDETTGAVLFLGQVADPRCGM